MADLKQLEFYLLRYVPYVVSGDSVSIGVLLVEPRLDGFGFADVGMTSDWRRVYCLDRQVDIEVLQGLETYIRMQLHHSQDVGLLLHKLEDSFSNLVQMSPREVCLAEDPARELKTLCSIYLEEQLSKKVPRAARPKGERAVIYGQMKDALTRAGVWALGLEHISAGQYTKKKNDPVFFDFGYVVGSEVRFFQAVPLKTNSNQTLAVNLASRFPKIADCIYTETHASAQLTAIVADDLHRTHPDIEFALDIFKENQVQLATAADMPSIAERARLDLNA
ncbi:MAG: DUF3037 domain-containing protein [Terriglobales bacterium]